MILKIYVDHKGPYILHTALSVSMLYTLTGVQESQAIGNRTMTHGLRLTAMEVCGENKIGPET